MLNVPIVAQSLYYVYVYVRAFIQFSGVCFDTPVCKWRLCQSVHMYVCTYVHIVCSDIAHVS